MNGRQLAYDFARKLERERDEWKSESARLSAEREHNANVAGMLQAENAEMLNTIVELRREVQAMREVASNYEHRLQHFLK